MDNFAAQNNRQRFINIVEVIEFFLHIKVLDFKQIFRETMSPNTANTNAYSMNECEYKKKTEMHVCFFLAFAFIH